MSAFAMEEVVHLHGNLPENTQTSTTLSKRTCILVQPQNKISLIWKHFKQYPPSLQIPKSIAVCIHCFEKYKEDESIEESKWEIKIGESSSTSKLDKHIQRIHADLITPISIKSPKPSQGSMNQEDTSSVHHRKRKASAVEEKLEIQDLVSLSVQGSSFLLRRDFILEHDWMVAKILTSEVPFTSVNGQIYIDIDPVSFRVITSILLGITTETELTNFSDRELVLVIAAATHLKCLDLVEVFIRIQNLRKSIQRERDELRTELYTLKNSHEMSIAKSLVHQLPITMFQCNATRLHRSQMVSCGSMALLLGASLKSNDHSIQCDACGNQDRNQCALSAVSTMSELSVVLDGMSKQYSK
jgi:hypothetical protein